MTPQEFVGLSARVAERIEQTLKGSNATLLRGPVGEDIWIVVVTPEARSPALERQWVDWLSSAGGKDSQHKPPGAILVRVTFVVRTGRLVLEAVPALREAMQRVIGQFSELGESRPARPLILN